MQCFRMCTVATMTLTLPTRTHHRLTLTPEALLLKASLRCIWQVNFEFSCCNGVDDLAAEDNKPHSTVTCQRC
jgi:hypothetical protein